MVDTRTINFSTKGMTDIVDITGKVTDAIAKSKINSGIACVFVPGSTGGITTIEYEPGLLRDLPEVFEKIIPSDRTYHHDATWGDGNGFSHLRSAIIKTSLAIPFVNKKLTLGTWQQIIFLDFDNRSRNRKLIVQVVGE